MVEGDMFKPQADGTVVVCECVRDVSATLCGPKYQLGIS